MSITDSMVGAKEEPPVKPKPTFNPQVSYRWSPDEIFPLKGGELHALKQILNALIDTPEAQRAIAAYEALKLVDNIIKEGVENEKIKPANTDEVEQS